MIGNGAVSFWWQQLGGPPAPKAPLGGSIHVDVCIVGAGYTGLWTAYTLATLQPDLRIAVVDARFAGYGASGRNGGWLTNSVTGGRERYARSHGRDAAIAQQRALNDAVSDVLAFAAREGADIGAHLGGELTVARTPAQLARLDRFAESEAAWPVTDVERWDAARTAEELRVDGTLGALWHPHCARIQPALLVQALVRAAERLGVRIYDHTRVREIRPGIAVTDRGEVRATHVVRATEGFTAGIRATHRTWLPMNSSMIVTEPIPEAVWDAIGWQGRATLGDMAHVYMYAQRTADDRIAFGGRGDPYRFGSRIDTDGATPASTVEQLTALLRTFFPAARDVPIAHAWSGVLGVPRDWAATVGHDPHTGLGWAGGYVGTGVTATNLAGRTLAELILGLDTERTRLPWVGHTAKRWEPEPLRWLAVQGIYAAYRGADRAEAASGSSRTSVLARIAGAISGH